MPPPKASTTKKATVGKTTTGKSDEDQAKD